MLKLLFIERQIKSLRKILHCIYTQKFHRKVTAKLLNFRGYMLSIAFMPFAKKGTCTVLAQSI